jgi:hypothetical protein
MTSGAGIIIPASIGPAVEFSGSEFDAKVGRECRSDPVGERERIKRNNSERKRSDFHFRVSLALTVIYRIPKFAARSVPVHGSGQVILDEAELDPDLEPVPWLPYKAGIYGEPGGDFCSQHRYDVALVRRTSGGWQW